MGLKSVFLAFNNLISFSTMHFRNAFALKVSNNITSLINFQIVSLIVEMEWSFLYFNNVMTKMLYLEMGVILHAKLNLDSFAQLSSQANVLCTWILT